MRMASSKACLLTTVLMLAMLAMLVMLAVGDVSSECAEKGFTRSLACSTCTALKEITALDVVVQDCMGCCTPDDSNPQFSRAVLEICDWKLGQFPEVKSFIDRIEAQENGLPVQVSHGEGNHECTDPILRLVNDVHGTQESWGVSDWNADQIQSFVKAKVASPST